MRKIFLFILIPIFFISQIFADTNWDTRAAEFLADKWIITNSDEYHLDSNITRREMLKVMMNLSWREFLNICEWIFQDLTDTDWGCKYAEAAYAAWFIAWNDNFRPDDFVTEVEALKMISQAISMDTYESGSDWNWWDKYVNWAKYFGILSDYDSVTISYSQRSKVFYMAAKTFSDIWEATIVKWTYENCYPAWWPVSCIKIDQKKYPLVYTNWEYILLDKKLSKNLWDVVDIKILEQNRLCNEIDSLGCNLWISKAEVVNNTFDEPGLNITFEYPIDWIYRISWNYIAIWPEAHNGLDASQVIMSDMSMEEFVAERSKVENFNFFAELREVKDITTSSWYMWKQIIIDSDVGVMTSAILITDDGNYIFQGEERILELYLDTFRLLQK